MLYKGSRYTNTPLVIDGEIPTFSDRDLMDFNYQNSKSHIWTEGDTIDGVAFAYYGNSQLWWVIMDANVKYQFPTDIRVGDIVLIPAMTEVLDVL